MQLCVSIVNTKYFIITQIFDLFAENVCLNKLHSPSSDRALPPAVFSVWSSNQRRAASALKDLCCEHGSDRRSLSTPITDTLAFSSQRAPYPEIRWVNYCTECTHTHTHLHTAAHESLQRVMNYNMNYCKYDSETLSNNHSQFSSFSLSSSVTHTLTSSPTLSKSDSKQLILCVTCSCKWQTYLL